MPEEVLLNSWKEIARYVGRSERTVQRWERQCSFPVRRPAGKMRSAVIAIPSEIRAWSQSSFKNGISEACRPADNTSEAPVLIPQPKRLPTILCIDDHPEGLAVRKALLEALGFRVLAAPNPRLGMRLFDNHEVDLVVLDYWISALGGECLSRLLQQLNPRVPVLLLSGANRNVPDVVLRVTNSLTQNGVPPDTILTTMGATCGDTVPRRPNAPLAHATLDSIPDERAA